MIREQGLSRDVRPGDGFGVGLLASNPGDAAVTLTPGQILGGIIAGATLTVGRAYTMPLAATFAAAVPEMSIGDTFLLLVNALGNTITMTTNTGWTLTGTLTVATATSRFFLITRTGAATFAMVGL
jgi:hypothetical protein